jgi:hypothetical protein
MFKTETKIEIEATCDQCKWRKSEDPKGDGWFVAFPTKPAHLEEYQNLDGVVCQRSDELLPFNVNIYTWQQKLAEHPDAKHLCRVECAKIFIEARLWEFETALLPKEEVVEEAASAPEPEAEKKC